MSLITTDQICCIIGGMSSEPVDPPDSIVGVITLVLVVLSIIVGPSILLWIFLP